MNINMSMKLLRCCVGLLLCGAGWAHAQTGAAALEKSVNVAERERIQHKRQAIDQALGQAETACYQRFAVEDCLRQERQQAHKEHVRLRQQEATLDQAERRERVAQRLKAIAERESTQPAPVRATSHVKKAVVHPADPAPPVNFGPEKEQKELRPDALSRDQEARERARQQQEKRNAHQASQAGVVSSQATQAAKARQLRDQKNAAAARHKAQVLQSQANDAAAGRKPAAPLSPSP